MRRIIFVFILVFSLYIVGCKADEGDYPRGYKPMGLENSQLLNSKSYTVGTDCNSSTQCASVIYSGSRGSSNYVGIAIDNSHTVTPATFRVLIYWNGSLSGNDENFNLPPEEYSIKIWNGSNYYQSLSSSPSTANNLNITLTVADGAVVGSVTSKVYTITFVSSIDVGSLITAGDTIVAHRF